MEGFVAWAMVGGVESCGIGDFGGDFGFGSPCVADSGGLDEVDIVGMR